MQVHIWFVAHPRMMNDWKGTAPNLYDISGSAHWHNKADVGLVVHRIFKEIMLSSKQDVKDYTKKFVTQIGVEKVIFPLKFSFGKYITNLAYYVKMKLAF